MTFSKDDLKFELESNQQLISYKIVDRLGIIRGEVKDIYYDANNEINLLIALSENGNKLKLRRLAGSNIRKIDSEEKSILTDLSDLELEKLPLYRSVPIQEETDATAYNDDAIEQYSNQSQVYNISLLEEKLRVARRKRKVGEVVIRKQVETRMIQVPVRREKLIVERTGENPERLTEVVIGEEKVNGFNYTEMGDSQSLHITKSHFINLQTAQQLLSAIANLSSADNAKVRIEIVTNSSEHQIEHQDICDRHQ